MAAVGDCCKVVVASPKMTRESLKELAKGIIDIEWRDWLGGGGEV